MRIAVGTKRRVLYLDTAPSVGGSVISLYELLRRLDRDRYEPFVVCYTPHEYVDRFRALSAQVWVWNVSRAVDHRPAWAGPAREAAPARWLRKSAPGASLYHDAGLVLLLARRIWPRARALKRIIADNHIDCVHTNIRVGHDREGVLAARLAGIPCVCHVRDFERLNWLDRALARTVERFIYISRAVQQPHLDSGVPREKGRIVYNGLDPAAFDGLSGRDAVRQSLGLVQGDQAVGIVGRLEPWKGQDVFVRALALVRQSVPRARGIVVGDAVPYGPDYRGALLALCAELGLGAGLVFTGFRSDLPAVMQALDVLVLASVSPEPFGRVLIEAMAAGKPVVATDAGATREIIEDGVQGLWVPPGDVAALAHAIVTLLSHREQALAMGQAGRQRVLERFTVQQYVDGIQKVYRELLS